MSGHTLHSERKFVLETQVNIPGYIYGNANVPRSPLTLADLELLKASLLFDSKDVEYLRLSYTIVKDEVEAILDVWYGFVGATPHLLESFTDPHDGKPIPNYLGAVRKRFGQWILDTARAEYDQTWLDYQHEIGLRHYRTKKNKTDGVSSTSLVPFRYLMPLVFPITFTLKPFLAQKGHAPEIVEGMYAAWVKSCILQVTLWSYPYIRDNDF